MRHIRVLGEVEEILVGADLHLGLAAEIRVQDSREYDQVAKAKNTRRSDGAG